jgi:hypothetical protein
MDIVTRDEATPEKLGLLMAGVKENSTSKKQGITL